MTPEAGSRPFETTVATTSGSRWMLALVPLVLLGVLLAFLIWSGPGNALRSAGAPPVERLSFQRVTLEPGVLLVTLLNDGPDAVAISQVAIDDAFWTFTAEGGQTLEHLRRTTLRIPYPWVQGETHHVKVLTSTGAAFEHDIEVALATPTPSAHFLGVFTLIGLYVGVLPVAIGLMWFPWMSRLSSRAMDFLLALTIGLLAFLFVDGTHEGLDAAGALPESFQGAVLFALTAAAAFLLLEAIGTTLKSRRSARSGGSVLAFLVAVGIGLHNFGEGLAIGSAFALGAVSLGTLLIIGFALHNTTEGLAIIAPLARERQRPSVLDLIKLGVIGGAPTIVGAWVGGFVYSPVWSVLFLAIGVGAIAQVIIQIGRQVGRGAVAPRPFASGTVLAGLVSGFAVMYVTGMLVG